MEGEDNNIYLIAGATGSTGTHITKSLIAKGKIVRVLVRDEKRAKSLLSEVYDKLESVIICDLVNDLNYKEKLKQALAPANNRKVTFIISTLSYNWDKAITCYDGNVTTNTRLIEACTEAGIQNIEKFVLLSSTHVRRPWSYVSITCNINKKGMQWCKVIVEDLLRKSGLKYLIIRPVGLNRDLNAKETGFTLDQGDKIEGMINRSTVGRLTVDTMLDKHIPDNTSYECISYEQDLKKDYNYVNGEIKLKPETEEEKKLIDHLFPARVVEYSVYLAISFSIFSIFYMAGKNYLARRIGLRN